MHIGYARFTQRCDIDFFTASSDTLGTELRVGLIEAFVQLGHKVTVLSHVPEDQVWLFERPDSHPIYDYRFLNSVAYQPAGQLPDDLDILFMEGSVDNVKFGGKNLERFVELMHMTQGLCCIAYHHGGPGMCVPLGSMYEYGRQDGNPSYSHLNLRNLFKGIHRNSNRWFLWTHAIDADSFAKKVGKRPGYAKECEKAIFLPIGYSANFDRPLVETDHSVDLIYVGREKTGYRTERLVQLYGQDSCCKRLLYGNWKHPPPGWLYGGMIPGHGKVYMLLPQAKATIHISDKWFYERGLLTTRIVEGIRAGIANFVDAEYHGAEVLLGEGSAAFITNHEEIHQHLPYYREIAEVQKKRLQTWDVIVAKALDELRTPA